MLVNYRFHCSRYEMILMLSIRLCFSQDIALPWKIPVHGSAENTSLLIINSLFFIKILSFYIAVVINQRRHPAPSICDDQKVLPHRLCIPVIIALFDCP